MTESNPLLVKVKLKRSSTITLGQEDAKVAVGTGFQSEQRQSYVMDLENVDSSESDQDEDSDYSDILGNTYPKSKASRH